MTAMFPVKHLLWLLAALPVNLANQNCAENTNCDSIGPLKIDAEVDDSKISITWTFNQSEHIYGFEVTVYESGDSIIYKSPVLHFSQRSMEVELELTGKSKICVKAFKNATSVQAEQCENVEIKDLKMVIGIMAGTVFLIPCIVGISYVVYKDRKIRNSSYQKMTNEKTMPDEIVVVVHGKTAPSGRKSHSDIPPQVKKSRPKLTETEKSESADEVKVKHKETCKFCDLGNENEGFEADNRLTEEQKPSSAVEIHPNDANQSKLNDSSTHMTQTDGKAVPGERKFSKTVEKDSQIIANRGTSSNINDEVPTGSNALLEKASGSCDKNSHSNAEEEQQVSQDMGQDTVADTESTETQNRGTHL